MFKTTIGLDLAATFQSAKAGFSSTGKNPSTAARSRLAKPNAVNAIPAHGPTPEWPSKAKSPCRLRNAARNGNTPSSPSTKPAKANPVTPSWRCCDEFSNTERRRYPYE